MRTAYFYPILMDSATSSDIILIKLRRIRA